MPTTRKKQIKTVSKDERSEGEAGDFSDSGSDWKISGASSSEDEDVDTHLDFEGEEDKSSGDDFRKAKKAQKDVNKPPIRRRKPQFAKDLINKINKQVTTEGDQDEISTPQFSVKDLTEADKLLPSFLDLSESDSSDDDSQSQSRKKATTLPSILEHYSDGDSDKDEYQDVWSSNIQDNSEDIAKKTFMELEKHKSEIEQTKASIENYVSKNQATQSISTSAGEFNVNDLLAQGEEVAENKNPPKNKMKVRKRRDDSDSEVEDWEEVNEAKSIPQQGLQLFVEFPNASKKSKKLDLEMMMKRKINRVKKEYQVYMHKVHVLCWLGHGNYVSRVLNDQEVMAAALAMVPKGCYPEERLTTKYVEQITTWYKDKLTLKQDKNEHKFRPKAPPLKTIILGQIKNRVTTAKKYNIFIFVAMLRALGLQCRVMFNFVTLPIKPSHSELCSLSIKPKDDSKNKADKSTENAGGKSVEKNKPKTTAKSKAKCTKKIAQVDGIYDTLSESDSEFESIMQLDGSNDPQPKVRNTRATRTKKAETNTEKDEDDGVSPPKRAKAKSNTDDIPNRKDKGKISKSDNNEDKPSEATKALRKRAVRSKSASKTTDTKPLVKDIVIEDKDMADDSKDKLKEPHTTTLRKTARNKNETSKPENVSTKTEVLEKGNKTKKVTDNSKEKQHETTTLPSQRSARNKDGLSKKSATNKQETSKSPQTKNNAQNSKPGETSIGQNETAISSISSKTLSPNLSKAKDTVNTNDIEMVSPRKTRSERRIAAKIDDKKPTKINADKIETPAIIVTDGNSVESNFFTDKKEPTKRLNLSRKRSHTTVNAAQKTNGENDMKPKTRTKSAPGTSIEKSKYFESEEITAKKPKLNNQNRQTKKEQIQENKLRVSHRDLRQKAKPKNDVTEDLVDIIKSRIKLEKAQSKKSIVKGKIKDDSDEDSDFLPVEEVKSNKDSDEDFKPTKISPKPSKIIAKPGTSKNLDRRVLSSDDDVAKKNKIDVWCEVFVEELEQWIAVDVIKGKVHCPNEIYAQATHPVCYIVGWDNNNYLKDLTRRYVPHWNTVTRKQRAEPDWWKTALQPWLGPKTARDKEEDEYLDKMQLEAPLPKSIAEYKNHPLYALKRHLLKFEALYPPDARTLGFVRGEAVYDRACVHTCQSRDKWLKEAKVVKLGEQPYKIVRARPTWDKVASRISTEYKPLEIFGPWQVQDYEPPIAENGIVPRNAYGNVELFKESMLPKKTVHIRLPGLNRVAKKLNIDCAPAMTGFDFNGGWSHPIYDGFVVCEEFEEIITEAWIKDQEDQERREREKIEQRVYGNWKHLIRALMIRERLKLKYGFEEPAAQAKPKPKGPRLVVKKK